MPKYLEFCKRNATPVENIPFNHAVYGKFILSLLVTVFVNVYNQNQEIIKSVN